jgi:hypothetical protein
MKIIRKDLEKKAEEAVQICLSKVPFLKIESIRKEPVPKEKGPDFLVRLALPEGEKDLIVEVKGNGQPKPARDGINQLLRYKDAFPGAYGILVAPYISQKAAEICAAADIGYVDLAGNCRLSFGQVYIEQKGEPNPFAQKRDLRSLYSPKAERVLRVLLSNPGKAWKMAELADEAGVSLGQVSNVKKLLLNREWVQAEKSGLKLTEPRTLLTEWSENYSFRRNHLQNYYSLKNIADIEADLADVCNRSNLLYAFTGFSGAARLAPAVKYQRVFAYVEEAQEDVAKTLGFKRVASGANVSLLLPYDEGVFYSATDFEGVQIASPVQIYFDLCGFRGRGEEAAQQLLSQVILPRW